MSQHYAFLPYLRQGLATQITHVDDYGTNSNLFQERASFNLNVKVDANSVAGGSSPLSISKMMLLKGPGDIVGINSKAVIKVYPSDWVTTMEPNMLPYIEFYEEDFPWRYTPAQAKLEGGLDNKARLRPWISLVVLEESEFEEQPFNGIVSSVKILDSADKVFPFEQTMWAWAHVHVYDYLSGTIDDALGDVKNTIDNRPDRAVSRILCPRRLQPNTAYHAFLIPTFETGRLAGLGETNLSGIDAMKASWNWGGTPTPAGTEYPVYHRWFFKTGARGDFESLVTMLKPKQTPALGSKRYVDMQLPGHELIDNQSGNIDVLGIQGILRPTGVSPSAWPPSPTDTFTPALTDILNAPDTYQSNAQADDPIIAPPIYGRWHAKRERLDVNLNKDWLHTANLDPRYRIIAGAGAEVVRKNQDEYMRIAWEQVGEIIEANKKIRQLQIAEKASEAMYAKHILLMPTPEDVLSISGTLHTKVQMPSSNISVYKEAGDSVLPDGTFSGAFRRITRPGSTMMKAINNSNTPASSSALIIDLNAGNAALAYANPAQINTVAVYNVLPVSQLTSSYTQSLPSISNFVITSPGAAYPAFSYGTPNSLAAAFTNATASFHGAFSAFPVSNYSPGPSMDTVTAAERIKEKTFPKDAILDAASNDVLLADSSSTNVQPLQKLEVILAAPQINLPMYRELAKLSADWLMPGLNDIENNSITALEVSQAHIEALMLGVNHEMSRELLWRGYPTDQRGTYFSFFWGYESLAQSLDPNSDLTAYKDITPIHTWADTSSLGQHSSRSISMNNMLVLVIRGDLLKKYPGTLIYMNKSKWKGNGSGGYLWGSPRELEDGEILFPEFYASLQPDLYFLGFNISAAMAKGGHQDPQDPGYYFVFQERATDLQFGANEIPQGNTSFSTGVNTKWDNLNWRNIQSDVNSRFIDPNRNITLTGSIDNPDNVYWGHNAADMAHILLQVPVQVNIHAKDLL